jgi:hypothetical protein
MLYLYYTSLTSDEKQALLDEIVKRCECRETTARAWCREERRPNPLAQNVISEMLNVPRGKLFPPKEKSFPKPVKA